jgi:DNA-binding NtrC family response regulator
MGILTNIARSAAMQELTGRLSAAIGETGGVLVTGESGAGHDTIARAIHLANDHSEDTSGVRLLLRAILRHPSPRPFVALDCSDRLDLEERLFGAATTAVWDGVAVFEQLASPCMLTAAHGGTLVLRHIPEMPARLQVRLGRLLRRGEAYVVQAGKEPGLLPVAVRVVGTAEGEGDLEPELLRRLPVTINVPPLRERREDIPGLVRCLLDELSMAAGVAPKVASRQASELLSALPWRGNISELEALLRALVTHIPGRHIRLSHVLEFVRLDGRATVTTYTGTLKEARECFERDYVAAVLDRHRGRMAEAARTLGLQRTNLYRKVRQLSVTRGSAKRQLSER